ncbi:MAG TPA: hypothetical protein VJ063_13410 [Verrucomicrobiae bacterium]|nr:hypothetical protein [Verrucomicrobiae bacterium]
MISADKDFVVKPYNSVRVAAFCGIVLQTVAQVPTNWQQRNPTPPVEHPGDITFDNSRWILVDQIGATLTSADAKGWDRVAGPPSAQRVIYAENQFVAVTGDFNSGAIYTSTDRENWQLRQSTPGNLTGLAYGNGVFVATGNNSAWVSQDGVTWRPVNTGVSFWLPEVIFSQGKFVAVGGQHENFAPLKPLVSVSTNGVDWVNVNPPGEPFLRGVACGNGTFVANGDGGNFLTSPDAITWTMHGHVDEPPWLPPIRFTAIEFGNGEFVAASEHYIYYSTNGIDWTAGCLRCEGPSSAYFASSEPFSIAFGNGRFLAVATNGTMYTATDPARWSVLRSPEDLNAVAYGNSHFVAVGAASTVWSSQNGNDWSWAFAGRKDIGPPDLFGVSFGKGIFVAVGGLGPYIATSSDGTQWTTQQREALGTFENLRTVTFGNGLFVAAGERSVGPALVPKITISSDGTNWTYPSVPSTPGSTLYGAGYGNGVYIVAGDQGTILRSTEGTNWTVQSSGTMRPLRAVAFRNGRFIVGGDAGTIIISTDGNTWSPSSPASFSVRGLAAGEGVVAVGNSQNDGALHYSSDGLGWPGDRTSFAKILNGVAYGNGGWVAVGNGGLILHSGSGEIRLRDPRMTSEWFEFWIEDPSGRGYTIQASTDLVNWTSLETQLFPSTTFIYRDRNASAHTNRMYRVISP